MQVILTVALVAGIALGERPWLLDKASSLFVKSAVEYRDPKFPANQASSVAARIIDGALSPPQVTQVVNSLSEAFIQHGTVIPGPQALSLVEMVSSAYGEIRKSVGFTNYLGYISANARNYNYNAMMHDSNAAGFPAILQESLRRLQESAEGRQAYEVAMSLAGTMERDAGLPVGEGNPADGPAQGRQQPFPRPYEAGQPHPVPRPQAGQQPERPQPWPNYEQPRPFQPQQPQQPRPFQPQPRPYATQPYAPEPQFPQRPEPNERPVSY